MRSPRLVRLAVAAAAVAFLATGTSAAADPAARFRPPLPQLTVAEPFDEPEARWLPGHRGVDLTAAAGSEVRSPAAGTVSFAGTVVDRPVVSIDHGGLRTTYEPVLARVARGQSVAPGDVIGVIGDGGHCSGRCLHWGAIVDERYLDPLALLIDYRPVLKPPR